MGFEPAFSTTEMPARKPIRATPFVWRDPRSIPPRRWLYGNHYIREFISVTAAPGGLGKSSLSLVEIIAMVTGRPLLGIQPKERIRAWHQNLEDPLEEIERRLAAICIRYEIHPAELAGRLFVNSGRDCPVCVATETKDGVRIVQPAVDELKAEMLGNGIELLVIDPFVSSHEVSENDNNRITIVKNVYADIASATSAAVELVHHVRKGASGQTGEHTVDDARGAGALVAGARSARILNGMSKDQAEKAEVENPKLFFSVTTGKANLAPPPDKALWYCMVGVALGNGGNNPFDQGDSVGVATSWEWPDHGATVTVAHLRRAQEIVSKGEWRENIQAKNWIGNAVAQAMDLDAKLPADKQVIKAALAMWFKSKMFVTVTRKDKNYEDKTFVEVGELATD